MIKFILCLKVWTLINVSNVIWNQKTYILRYGTKTNGATTHYAKKYKIKFEKVNPMLHPAAVWHIPWCTASTQKNCTVFAQTTANKKRYIVGTLIAAFTLVDITGTVMRVFWVVLQHGERTCYSIMPVNYSAWTTKANCCPCAIVCWHDTIVCTVVYALFFKKKMHIPMKHTLKR